MRVFRRALLGAKRWLLVLDGLAGAGRFLLAGRRARPGLTVLCYHRVSPGVPLLPPFDPLNVAPRLFRAHLDALVRSGVPVLDAAGIRDRVHGAGPHGTSAAVALTFDDVWARGVDAARALAARSLPGVFFVPTAHVDAPMFPFIAFDTWYVGRPSHDPRVTRPARRADLERLKALGMDVQPHSHSHRSLGAMAPDEAGADIRRSAELLREWLGVSITMLAYPYGGTASGHVPSYADEVVREAGFALALTTDAGVNGNEPHVQDRYRLRRMIVRDVDAGIIFRAKAAGYTGFLPALQASRGLLSRRTRRGDRGDGCF